MRVLMPDLDGVGREEGREGGGTESTKEGGRKD